jgi:hypothetical protein
MVPENVFPRSPRRRSIIGPHNNQHQYHAAACFNNAHPRRRLLHTSWARKEAIPKQVFSQPAIHCQQEHSKSSYIIQLGGRQQAGDDDSRSMDTIRRHNDEVVLGNTSVEGSYISCVQSADLKEKHCLLLRMAAYE